MLAVGAGGGCLDIFSLVYLFSFLSPFLWETTRYRLKYCLRGPLSLKQQTNQVSYLVIIWDRFITLDDMHLMKGNGMHFTTVFLRL